MFKKIVILILFLVGATVLNANQDNINDTKTEKVDQKKGSSKNSQKKDENILDIENMVEANILLEKINKIEAGFKDNILLKRYSNYLSYSKISADLEQLKDSLKRKNNLSDELEYQLLNKIRVKENELELISEYKGSPIGSLINPPEIEIVEKITNPFGIINALSSIKKMEDSKQQFTSLESQLEFLSKNLEEELDSYRNLYVLEPKDEYKEKIAFLDKQKRDFDIVLDIVTTTQEVYGRKIEQVILEIKNQISQQVQKMLLIFAIIVIMLIVSFLVKLTLKRYFSQNENYYMVNKIINFTLAFLVLMLLLFSYIDNVSYLVTILGFASAGIAIALKDWFMSIFGWLVIVTSGFIQVG